MGTYKKYDTIVCEAVKNDPCGFIDLLIMEADKQENKNIDPLLREAACVIANLLSQMGDCIIW